MHMWLNNFHLPKYNLTISATFINFPNIYFKDYFSWNVHCKECSICGKLSFISGFIFIFLNIFGKFGKVVQEN